MKDFNLEWKQFLSEGDPTIPSSKPSQPSQPSEPSQVDVDKLNKAQADKAKAQAEIVNLQKSLQAIQTHANNLQSALQQLNLQEAKRKRAKVTKKKSGDRCTRIAKRKYDVWPSAYASGAVVKCRQGKIWKGISENATDEEIDLALLTEEIQIIDEEWSEKYKRSINCKNPKGFSQKAHCQGRKKK